MYNASKIPPRCLPASLIGSGFVIAASVLLAIAVVGPSRIDPRNTSWLVGDFAQMQFGWLGYRFDPSSAWPIETSRLSWPLPLAIAMLDLVPIAAFPLKLLSAYLPSEFQYFGALFVFNAGLQGLFAFLLFHEIAKGMPAGGAVLRLMVAVMAALFIVASPTLYMRFAIEHPPLTAHWLIIAALWLYARCDRVSLVATIGGFTALLFLCGGINPYLFVMTSGVYFGCLLRLLWQGRWSLASLAWGGVIPFAAAGVSLLAFGFVTVGGDGVIPGSGYGFYSSNALSLIDPMKFPGATVLPAQTLQSQGQYEGYGYLGFGAILMIAIGLLLSLFLRRIFAGFSVPLLVVAGGAFILALSTAVTIGPHLVAQVSLPPALMSVLEILRGSGRFIWVTNYGLVTLGAVLVMRLLPTPAALCVLGTGLVLQAIDLAPAFRASHDRLAEMKSMRFMDPAFADLGHTHNRLVMVPPWQCRSPTEAGYPVGTFERVSFLVMDNQLATNNFQASRLPRDQARYHCGEFPRSFPTTAPDLKSAYLFTPPAFVELGAMVLQTHSCDVADNLVLCRGDRKVGFTARASAMFDGATAREEQFLHPVRSTLWPILSQGFEQSGDALQMTERDAHIHLLSHLWSDTPHRLEIEMTRGPDTKGTASVDVYVNSLLLGSLEESSKALRGAFWVPAGLMHDGRLILAIDDHSPNPIHAALDRLMFRPEMENSSSVPMTFDFAFRSGRNPWLGNGWSPSEPWGTWSEGPVSTLYIPRTWLGQGPLSIIFNVEVFLAPSRGLDAQTVRVSADGISIGTFQLSRTGARMEVTIPSALLSQGHGALALQFDLPTSMSPSRLGVSSDARQLAIGLKSLTIQSIP